MKTRNLGPRHDRSPCPAVIRFSQFSYNSLDGFTDRQGALTERRLDATMPLDGLVKRHATQNRKL